MSVRCAIACAERLGRERPDWELSVGSLAIAVAHRPERFLDKQRWAMDWYYPILGGVMRGDAAHARIAARWDQFVVPKRGVRCVSDQPWVTAAETCECVMALDAIGAHDAALELFGWVQFLRDDDGAYWTGANFDGEHWDLDGELYPVEKPTWNSAAVVLAANALGGHGPDRRPVPRRAACRPDSPPTSSSKPASRSTGRATGATAAKGSRSSGVVRSSDRQRASLARRHRTRGSRLPRQPKGRG